MNNFINEFKSLYPYEFYDEQNEGIKAIYEKKSLLATLATGSGKSLFAEFAIQLAITNKKKIIYTSPIKSLSNQKFQEFSSKFPSESIGILTGDIKFNPSANILIMTTEILRNLLYKQNDDGIIEDDKFNVNISMSEVSHVIFDEIHFINDESRGKIWEESLILLPRKMQLIMLSATLSNPREFADWIEKINEKEVHIVSKKERLIPLKHFLYYNMKYPGKKAEKLTEKEKFQKLFKNTNKLVEIVNEDNEFDSKKYIEMNQLSEMNRKLSKYINPKATFNVLLKTLKKKNLLPCIFFVFSRKKCEQYATETDFCFNTKEEQSEVENIINSELRKLNNYKIYLESRQLMDMKKLLIKGIAYHHSGILPILKEIVEILYSNKLVKVLFATETFAIGVNMPANSVIFTDVKKYSDNGMRYLHTHEYAQIAGRSSRPGLSSNTNNYGTVILLQNFFDLPEIPKMKNIMTGKSQVIESKFTLNYQFLTNVILSKNNNLDDFLNKTLMKNEANIHINNLNVKPDFKETKYETELFDEYYLLKNSDKTLNKNEKKQRNNRCKEIEKLEDFSEEYQTYLYNYEIQQKIHTNNSDKKYYSEYLENDMKKILMFLTKMNYVKYEGQKLSELSQADLTIKGVACSFINEVNELLLTELFFENIFDDLTPHEFIAILGLFCHSKNLSDDNHHYNAEHLDISDKLYYKIKQIEEIQKKLIGLEESSQIFLNNEWELNYDFVETAYKWPHVNSFYELEYDNFIGNFIKDMIKIDNIVKEIELIAKLTNRVHILNNTKHISEIIMKDVVDIQSLYIVKNK